jgi:hypothetical protein
MTTGHDRRLNTKALSRCGDHNSVRDVRSLSGTTHMAGMAGASITCSEYTDAGTNARNVVTAQSANSRLQSWKRKRRAAS